MNSRDERGSDQWQTLAAGRTFVQSAGKVMAPAPIGALVLFHEAEPVDLIVDEEPGVAEVFDRRYFNAALMMPASR